MMVINTKYKIKDIVYLSTDPEQQKRMVTGYTVREHGIVYLLSCGANESTHFDYEITEEVNVLITSTN